MAADPSNRRNVFLLARSYDDGGELPRALANYERRVLLGGWDEEVFYAALSAARVREKLKAPYESISRAYLDAWARRPQRAEPLYDLARAARAVGRIGEARELARRAAEIPLPTGEMLFVEPEVYAWRALDELAGSAFLAGDYEAAREANQRLLEEGRVPEGERARVEANRGLCDAKARQPHLPRL